MIDIGRIAGTIALRLPSARSVAVGASVVLLLIVAGGGGWYWHLSAQRKAAEGYAAALARAHTARATQAPPDARAAAVRDLEAVLQTHPSHPMAAQTAYELASLRHADRQHAAARSAYEVALARGAGGTLRTLARLGIAYAWEAERNLPKAAESLETLVTDLKPREAFFEEALLDLARIQELAGRKDDAVRTYRRVLKEVAQTRHAEEVRLRLASLGVAP